MALLTGALFVAGTLLVGAAGSLVTRPALNSWYRTLRKPALTPPDSFIAFIWGCLYILMGAAAAVVWLNRGDSAALAALSLYAAQLILNFWWSWIFFGRRKPGVALLCLSALWLAAAATAVFFWLTEPVAGVLMLPAVAWLTFAAYLNWRICELNKVRPVCQESAAPSPASLPAKVRS